MKHLVLVDPKSVKKNPVAGLRLYQDETGPSKVTIGAEGRWPEEDELCAVDCHLTKKSYIDGVFRWEAVSFDTRVDVLVEFLKSGWEKFTVDVLNQVQDLQSVKPEPDYLYEHDLDTKVKCRYCGHKAKPEEFESETYGTEFEDRNYLENICPSCYAVDAIVYETLRQAAKRCGKDWI